MNRRIYFIMFLLAFFFASCKNDYSEMIKQNARRNETVSIVNNYVLIYSVYNHKMPASIEDLASFIISGRYFDGGSRSVQSDKLLFKKISSGKYYFMFTVDSCFYYNQSTKDGFIEGGLPKAFVNWPRHYWHKTLRPVQKRKDSKYGEDADTSIIKRLKDLHKDKKFCHVVIEHPIDGGETCKWYSPIDGMRDTVIFRYFVHILPHGNYFLDLPEHPDSTGLLFCDEGKWKEKKYSVSAMDSVMNVQSGRLSVAFADYMEEHMEIEKIIIPYCIIAE